MYGVIMYISQQRSLPRWPAAVLLTSSPPLTTRRDELVMRLDGVTIASYRHPISDKVI